MKGGEQVASVLRKRPELRSAKEVALVHAALQPLAFYQRLHPDPAACGPAQAHLCRAALLKELEQEDTLHEEGAPSVGFCLILSGSLCEYKRQYAAQSGAGRYLHKLGPGRGFGEEALTQAQPRLHSSTLVAAEPTELLVLRREDYVAMTAMAQQALAVSPALRSENDLLFLFALAATLLFFRPVPPPSLLQLTRALEPASAAPGQAVVGQGQPGGALYVVLQGSVAPHQRRRESVGNATERGGQGGDALQAGDAFGEDAMLHADGCYSHTIVAVEACQLVAIPRAAFDRVLRGLGCRLPFQPGQARRTLAQAPRRRTSATVHGLATQMHGLPFFSSFSADCMRHLAAGCTLAHACTGDRVIDQGSASSAFYVLLSGACSVFVRDQDLAHPTSARASEAVPANPLAPPGLASCPGLPGSPPGAPPEPTLFYDPTRRGTRTTGSSGSDLPASAGHPPSVPLTVQLGGPSESGPRRGGGRFVTTNDASMPSPRASSPSRRSRFATQASALTVSATQLEPFVSFCADPVSPRGGLNRVLLDPLERPDLGSCPVSPRAPLLPPALDDLPALSRDKPPRRTVPAPFVPPPWPAEGAASTRGGGAPAAARPRSPSVKGSRTQRGTAGTSPSRPTSARGSPRGNGLRGLSDEDFEKLVSSFRGGANAAPEPSKSAGGKEPLPALRSRGREQKGATGKAEPADGAKLGGTAGAGPSGARPWKGFLLSGGDADVDPAVDAKKRYGRLVRTCVEGDAFGELELLGPEPQLRAATVVATAAAELLVIPLDDYRRHIQPAHARQLAAHCEFLSCVPLFRALPPAALRGLVYRLRPREVTAKGALLVEQGHPADGLYVVHRGDCVSSVAPPKEPAGSVPRSPTAAAGRPGGGAAARVDLVVLGPGSVFGEACLSGAPLDYSVAAASARVEVLVLHPADVRALGGSLVSAVAALADAKAAFRAAHHSLAVAAGQRQGDEAGRQLPAWLQKLPAHLLATAQDGGLPDPLPSPRLAPLTGAATFPGPSSPGAQTPRRAPRLQLEIPPASDPQTGGVPSPSPRANEAGSPLGGRPKLGFSLSWPPRPNSPPGSPNRAAAPSPVDSSLEAHMAQVMGASWGLRSSA